MRTFIKYLFLYLIELNAVTAQNSERYSKLNAKLPVKSVLKIYPLSIIYGPLPYSGAYKLGLESMSGQKTSIQASVAYLKVTPVLKQIEKLAKSGSSGFKIKGYFLEAGLRYYFKNMNLLDSSFRPEGYYIMPKMSYARDMMGTRAFGYSNYVYTVSNLCSSVIVGKQEKIGNLLFDIYVGLGYQKLLVMYRDYYRYVKVNPKEIFLNSTPLRIHAGMSVGFLLMQ